MGLYYFGDTLGLTAAFAFTIVLQYQESIGIDTDAIPIEFTRQTALYSSFLVLLCIAACNLTWLNKRYTLGLHHMWTFSSSVWRNSF